MPKTPKFPLPNTISLEDARKALVDMFTGLANNKDYMRDAHRFNAVAKKLSSCPKESLFLNIQELAEYVDSQ